MHIIVWKPWKTSVEHKWSVLAAENFWLIDNELKLNHSRILEEKFTENIKSLNVTFVVIFSPTAQQRDSCQEFRGWEGGFSVKKIFNIRDFSYNF